MTRSSGAVFLVGGGPDTVASPSLLSPFVAAARTRAQGRGGDATIALILADDTGAAQAFKPDYLRVLDAPDLRVVDMWLRSDGSANLDRVADVDGIVVGGGPAPVYLAGLVPSRNLLLSAVQAGSPYLGFSAGAMAASTLALAGGWRLDGRAVCSQAWSESLDEVAVRDGLGLVPFTVDVHTAQAGLLGRTVTLPSLSGVPAVGIDENTMLHVTARPGGGDQWTISGTGTVWCVSPAESAALVRTRSAATGDENV